MDKDKDSKVSEVGDWISVKDYSDIRDTESELLPCQSYIEGFNTYFSPTSLVTEFGLSECPHLWS
jgi:hypothetical protein